MKSCTMKYIMNSVTVVALTLIACMSSLAGAASLAMNLVGQRSISSDGSCHPGEVSTLCAKASDGLLTLYKSAAVNVSAGMCLALRFHYQRHDTACSEYPTASSDIVATPNEHLANAIAALELHKPLPICSNFVYKQEMFGEKTEICMVERQHAASFDPDLVITVPLECAASAGQTCCQSTATLVEIIPFLRDDGSYQFKLELAKACECNATAFVCHNFHWNEMRKEEIEFTVFGTPLMEAPWTFVVIQAAESFTSSGEEPEGSGEIDDFKADQLFF